MKSRGWNRGLVIALSVGAAMVVAIALALTLVRAARPTRQAVPDHPLEAVFQPFTADELQPLSDGRYYVDTQIVLTAARGVEKPAIEALAESVGAKIVGYLELSGDYQLQFGESMTAEALTQAAASLEGNALVQRARLHEVYEATADSAPYGAIDWQTSRLRANYEDYQALRDPWSDGGSATPRKDWAIPGYPTGNDWWTEAVYLPQAWKVAEKSPMEEVRVGVIDSMFDTENRDLSFEKLYLNPKSKAGINTGDSKYSHGSHVSGIIGAKAMNGREIRGASPNAKLYGFSMFGEALDEGKVYSSYFMIKYAIAAMLGEGVKLFNISMGTLDLSISAYYDAEVLGLDATQSKALSDLYDASRDMQDFLERCTAIYTDFLIITSAGNNSGYRWTLNDNGEGYSLKQADETTPSEDVIRVGGSGRYKALTAMDPASPAAKHVLVVGSLDLLINVTGDSTEDGNVWSGPQTYVKSAFSDNDADIYAPGGTLTQTIHSEEGESTETFDILSTIPSDIGGTGMMVGTSMSTPVVTGIAALVWGYRPELTSEQLRFCLLNQVYVTNALMGYAPAELPMVDAMAAMRVADELLGPRRTAAAPATPAPEMAFFMGYAYTNPKASTNPEDFVPDNHVHIMMFDENWVQRVDYTQEGGESFTVTAPPGKYYVRVISEDGLNEYIGEYELKVGEPAHDAIELGSRAYALFRFGAHQTTKTGEWYEIGAGTVAAELGLIAGALDYEYDGHVMHYDPEEPDKIEAEATGVVSQYGLDVAYTMRYENGVSDFKYYPLGMQVDVGGPGIEPQFFDFSQITDAHLTNIEEMEDYAFLVRLDADQLATLTFTTVGAFSDLTGLGMSDGVMYVEFNPDMSFKSIVFDVGAALEALPYLNASAEYLMGYEFSDHPLREPREIEAIDPEELKNMLYQMFG